MAGNNTLHAAKEAKNDEFYTRLEDIEAELGHYESKFKGKTVFCNCDDPTWSNFWRYFHMNFEYLGLKKLISTHYEPGEVQTYKMEYTGGDDLNFEAGIMTMLSQNGDFRSPECLELLKESDIVATNPPFSLFREFIQTLVEYKKKFLILGNPNALHYKEVFPLIKANKVWLGFKSMGSDMYFIVTEEQASRLKEEKKEGSGYKVIDGKIYGRTQAVWYTNFDHKKRHSWLETNYYYSKRKKLYPELYPKYDNFNAINVDQLDQIPMDYKGVMGVPDGIFETYNPDQFELIGLSSGNMAKEIGVKKNYRGRTDLAYTDQEGNNKCPYSRILIKYKEEK